MVYTYMVYIWYICMVYIYGVYVYIVLIVYENALIHCIYTVYTEALYLGYLCSCMRSVKRPDTVHIHCIHI